MKLKLKNFSNFTLSLLVPLFLLLLPVQAFAEVWYVSSTNGNDLNSGTIMAPLASISAAVNDQAQNGDSILVSEGTYQEEILVEDFDTLTISGGWNADFSARNSDLYPTELMDPDITGYTTAFTFKRSFNCVLEGFTIQDFYKGIFSDNYNSGIDDAFLASTVAVHVTNNRMFNQRQYGIHFYSSYLVIEDNEIYDSGYANIAGHANYYVTHADINSNVIQGSNGYGLYLIGHKSWNIFNNFVSGHEIAGMNLNHCCERKYVLNNTIVFNNGSGIRGGYVPIIVANNNLIAFNGNYGIKRDGGYFIYSGNNLVFGNLPEDYYQQVAHPDDIHLDPMIDPVTFKLTSDSPAIDAGLDLTLTVYPGYPEADYFNAPRTLAAGGDGLYDIGAHEYYLSIPEIAENLVQVILEIPPAEFSNNPEERQIELTSKLQEVMWKLDEISDDDSISEQVSVMKEALKKLEKDILAKTDGFYGGKPKNDWIVTQEGQGQVYPVIINLMEAIQAELNSLLALAIL